MLVAFACRSGSSVRLIAPIGLFGTSLPCSCHEGIQRQLRYSSTHSLTSILDEGEWSTLRPGRLTAA